MKWMEDCKNMKENGIFTISLDFELYWGVRDKKAINDYESNLNGVKKAVKGMLELFERYDIHATWSAVGFLFADSVEELKVHSPRKKPSYSNVNLNPYIYINNHDNLYYDYHFAPRLIERILKYKGQEVGTHTFSHYYCLEEGQTIEQFDSDIASAVKIAKEKNITIKSLVFPRNQWNGEYLSVLFRHGINSYRGNEKGWMHEADGGGDRLYKRGVRLLDAYFNLSGSNTYNIKSISKEKPYNIPSSRFLRPVSNRLSILEWFRKQRILRAIKKAAINKEIFHLWWHPHNFGINIKKNLDFLEDVLIYFNKMKIEHGMKSLNMEEISIKITNNE